MRQQAFELEPATPVTAATGLEEAREFIAVTEIPRPRVTRLVRARRRAGLPPQTLLVEHGGETATGSWIAVRRDDGIWLEQSKLASSGTVRQGELLGTVVAALPPGKTLRYVRNLHRLPARGSVRKRRRRATPA